MSPSGASGSRVIPVTAPCSRKRLKAVPHGLRPSRVCSAHVQGGRRTTGALRRAGDISPQRAYAPFSGVPCPARLPVQRHWAVVRRPRTGATAFRASGPTRSEPQMWRVPVSPVNVRRLSRVSSAPAPCRSHAGTTVSGTADASMRLAVGEVALRASVGVVIEAGGVDVGVQVQLLSWSRIGSAFAGSSASPPCRCPRRCLRTAGATYQDGGTTETAASVCRPTDPTPLADDRGRRSPSRSPGKGDVPPGGVTLGH